jgi:endonuclease/exonuclease/phosphatase family metal-dependent hydrolase
MALPAPSPRGTAPGAVEQIAIATWNVRGYPEKTQDRKDWFSAELAKMAPAVVCIQEIADRPRVDAFLRTERSFTNVAFLDSGDGQDNAVFATSAVGVEDIPDPQGFQHPAQAAYVFCGGFDATVVTVHLSWTNVAMREHEKTLLRGVVTEMEKRDPDVIIVGDFNTTEPGIQELAGAIGMTVMVPQGQDGVGTTHAGNRYDHFLVSPDLANEEAVGCRIVTFQGADLAAEKEVSDHLPVMAWFKTDGRFRDRK